MTLQASLARHFDLLYASAAANLEGMTAGESLARPHPGGNCANWVLGHLVNVHNGVMGVLGEPLVWESEQLARAGFDPIESLEDAIDWDAMTERFLGSRERCVAAIERLSGEALAEQLVDPFGERTTRGQLLTLLAFHQAYHVGQLGVLRRVAGLPGAVKGPGQEEAEAAGARTSGEPAEAL